MVVGFSFRTWILFAFTAVSLLVIVRTLLAHVIHSHLRTVSAYLRTVRDSVCDMPSGGFLYFLLTVVLPEFLKLFRGNNKRVEHSLLDDCTGF